MKELPLEYVPIHTDLPAHRKTRRLARLLPESPVPVHLFLQELFRATGALYPTGEYPSDFEAPDVADLASWPGNPTSWTSALTDAGWIERTDDRWVIPNWREYGGRALDRRVRDRNRKRNDRAEAAPSEDTSPTMLRDIPSVTDKLVVPPTDAAPSGVQLPPTMLRGSAVPMATDKPGAAFGDFASGQDEERSGIPPPNIVSSGCPADTCGHPHMSPYRIEEEEENKDSFSSSSSSSARENRDISAKGLNDSLKNWGWRQSEFPPVHLPKLMENAPYSALEVGFARRTVEKKPPNKWSPGLLLTVILDERERVQLRDRKPGARQNQAHVGYHPGSTVFAVGDGDVEL